MESTLEPDPNEATVISIPRPMSSLRDRAILKEQIAQILRGGHIRRLILDFTRARWFGVPILDELISTEQALSLSGGRLAIVTSNSTAARMLKAAHVDRVQLFPSVHSALSSFESPIHVAA